MELTISKAMTLWLRAALRECIAYGNHGQHMTVNDKGQKVCLDCEQPVQEELHES